MRRSLFAWAAVSALASGAFGACAASHPSEHGGGGNGGAGAATSSSKATSTSKAATGGGGSTGAFTGSVGTGCTPTCSADLRSVLDCNGKVMMTCPPNQGCGAMGMCVDPCQAAQDNQSTLGCEFYSVEPGPDIFARGSCFAAFVANTWDEPVTLSVDYGGTILETSQVAFTPVGSGQSTTYAPITNGQIAAGQIAVVFLASTAPADASNKTPCPAGQPLAMDPSIDGTGYGTAFHITTTAPVVAYDMYPYGGAGAHIPSATLLLPTVSWGTNYIAADAYKVDKNLLTTGPLEPFIQIVAAQDATSVTIKPSVDIVKGTGVDAATAGQSATYMVDKGQVLQFLQEDELAGSTIASDKPISVWGGSACMQIHVGESACDSGHQELLPIQSLGNEYAAVRYPDRASKHESVPWTIVGVTTTPATLKYDPAPPAGAPTSIQNGQVVEFEASDPFVVKSQDSQHPFYLAGHMTGGQSASAEANGLGDPEYVSSVPGPQFLNEYLFFTDPTYAYTNLVFVRKKGPNKKFADVTLDCAGTLTGWTKIDKAGEYETTNVYLVNDWAPQGNCDNGVHTATSDVPFGVTVWGWDLYTSYAYPAGLGVRPINSVVVSPK